MPQRDLSEDVERLRDEVANLRDALADRAGDLGARARRQGDAVARRARRGYQRAAHAVEETVDERPFAALGAALILGAVFALVFSAVRR